MSHSEFCGVWADALVMELLQLDYCKLDEADRPAAPEPDPLPDFDEDD